MALCCSALTISDCEAAQRWGYYTPLAGGPSAHHRCCVDARSDQRRRWCRSVWIGLRLYRLRLVDRRAQYRNSAVDLDWLSSGKRTEKNISTGSTSGDRRGLSCSTWIRARARPTASRKALWGPRGERYALIKANEQVPAPRSRQFSDSPLQGIPHGRRLLRRPPKSDTMTWESGECRIRPASGERDCLASKRDKSLPKPTAREYFLATRLWFALVASHIEMTMGWNARLAAAGNLASDPITAKPYPIPIMNMPTDPRRVALACRSHFQGWTPKPVKSGIIAL